MLLDKIINTENRKSIELDELKNSKVPNIIYGVGSYANDIMRLFNKLGIKISGACVDESYLAKVPEKFYGMNVCSIERTSRLYKECNVIVAYSNYVEGRIEAESYSNANVFFIDDPHNIDFFDYKYVVDNMEKFEETYNLLQDDKSKETLVVYINSKICGQPNDLLNYIEDNPYFNELLQFSNHEVFVDCGAFTGDTILDFTNKVNKSYKKIYAIEPDMSNYVILKNTIKENNIKSVELVNKGCWSEEAKFKFKSDGSSSTIIDEEGVSIIEVDAIDNIVKNDKITLIKMDIEGSELKALQGAKSTILRDKPKLAICIYHRSEDLITIPQYISKLVPGYKFYLRHHQFISWETVLYATC